VRELKGNLTAQMATLLVESGILETGHKKADARAAVRETGITNQQEVYSKMGMFANKTVTNALNSWVQLGKYCQKEFKIKDVSKITPERIGKFLEEKLKDGLSRRGLQNIRSYMQKYSNAFNQYQEKNGSPNRIDQEKLNEVFKKFKQQLPKINKKNVRENRAFVDPKLLTSLIKSLNGQLAGRLMSESGLRINEACLVKKGQIDSENGTIRVKGKGGKPYSIPVDPKTAMEINKIIDQKGFFRISKSKFYREFKDAIKVAEEKNGGPHGLRYGFAQRNYLALREQGMSHVRACWEVSLLMGHERPSITEHYIRFVKF